MPKKNRISMNSLVGEGELYSNMKSSTNDSCDVYLLLAWQVLRLFYARLHAVNFLTHCAPMAGSLYTYSCLQTHIHFDLITQFAVHNRYAIQ